MVCCRLDHRPHGAVKEMVVERHGLVPPEHVFVEVVNDQRERDRQQLREGNVNNVNL